MKPRTRRSGAGFTLVEVMVALGVAAIGMMAMLAWFSNMTSQQGILSQNMVAAGVQSTLTNLMSAPGQCTGNLTGLSWATPGAAGPLGVTKDIAGPSGPPTYLSTALNVYNTSTGAYVAKFIDTTVPLPNGFGLGVSSITLGNLVLLNTPAASNSYSGTITLNFSPIIPRHTPATATIILTTTSSGGTDTVKSCASSTNGIISCPAGYSIVGTPGTGDAYCISAELGPTDYSPALSSCYNSAANGTNPPQVAHLCTPPEWTQACEAGVLPAPGNEEWVDQPYNAAGKQGETSMGGSGFYAGTIPCITFNQGGHPLTGAPLNYRCCYR